jgi:group I intron endonuclease
MRGIYSITNIITGTVYYGQSKNIEQRFYRHRYQLKSGSHKNSHFLNAWNKYGKNAFIFAPIEIVEDVSISLTPIEQKYYDSTLNRYNQIPPADPTAWTAEMRKKISFANKGRIVSEEVKQKISRKGKKHSEETKQKMSGSAMGNKNNFGNSLSLETRKKISEHHKGNKYALGSSHPQTEEAKKNLSILMKGNKRALGHKKSQDSKKKQSETMKRIWVNKNKLFLYNKLGSAL